MKLSELLNVVDEDTYIDIDEDVNEIENKYITSSVRVWWFIKESPLYERYKEYDVINVYPISNGLQITIYKGDDTNG